MGDGLRRAFAAGRRTHWDGNLTVEMRRFLEALPDTGQVSAKSLRVVCTEPQNKARQKCRRLGLAVYAAGSNGEGWGLTNEGRAAIAKATA